MRWTSGTAWAALAGASIVAVVAISCAGRQAAAPPPAMTPVERGKYLVGVLGCGDCHTPGSLYGVPDSTRLLAGSELGWTGPWGTSYARNLTPDSTGIGSWSEEDIVTAIQKGQRPDHSPILPPMPWPDFAGLTSEDAHAVAAYLKTVPAVSHRVPDRLPPGVKALTALVFPPPPAYDAKNLPPPPAANASGEGAKK
jgi:mono/diheme cytochrome c family protein